MRLSAQNSTSPNFNGADFLREVNITVNRFKIQIMNKFNLPQDTKAQLLESVKNLQLSIEKYSKNSLSWVPWFLFTSYWIAVDGHI
jgi:hypothetical protein